MNTFIPTYRQVMNRHRAVMDGPQPTYFFEISWSGSFRIAVKRLVKIMQKVIVLQPFFANIIRITIRVKYY